MVVWMQEGLLGHEPHGRRLGRPVLFRRTSTPSMETEPSVTSYSRGTRAAMVVLPAPLGPTKAAS